ncbi:TolC family outer membrane protein [Solimicrobium silvestre]|uniref:Type I secretion outer membrane protein, TolC family n=1 Tax=Solimicrobium silvestre TaxID=2099400 RepID=A0A2S9GXJ9_9BURK|nr:TolC family outer membrane protein [Solimicrobium silvestre]PRC92439.1 Type I secretion outer membrane protein, TolC family [Solimicrobium silvestre]
MNETMNESMNNAKRKKNQIVIYSVLFASLIASGIFAAPASAADLLQTYQEALQNDPQYASARASLTAGQEKSVQGRALLLPTIGITGSTTSSSSNYSSGGVSVNGVKSTNGNYTLQLTQPLIHWENWQQYEQGKLQVLASEALFGQAQLDLMVRVSQAYFDVLSAQDTLESVRANKTAITEQLSFAKRNFEVGTTTITDQHEAQARYDLAVASEFAAENDLEIKRSTLQQIIGHEPDGLAPLHKGVQLSAPEPTNINDWVSAAEFNNYGVVGAQVTQEIAKRTISLNRAGHLPTLDLVANVNRSNNSAIPIEQQPAFVDTSRNIGIQLNIPLFSGFAVTSKVREAIALEDKAGNDFETAKRSAALAARQAYLGVNSGLAQVKAYEAAEISSQSALDSNVLGYQVGVRINIDVLNAQQQLYTTQQNLSKARYDTIMNGLRLKAAASSLKQEDLAQVNALLH